MAPSLVMSRIRASDVVSLAKPRLSMLVFCTTGVGLWLAQREVGPRFFAARSWRGLTVLLASALVVGAANALNSYLERDRDKLMRRTWQRPLPARRLSPNVALYLGTSLALVAMVLLYVAANPLTALLSFVAFACYVWIYTPMKPYSWAAVVVGAIPGAIPPLMGWTAMAGAASAGGWALFVLLFLWQLPHFFAIAIYLREDYARGGHRVLPVVISIRATQLAMLSCALMLWPATVLPFWVGIAEVRYAMVAHLTGAAFVLGVGMGLRLVPDDKEAVARWARRIFLASVLHLSCLLLALLVFSRSIR